MKNGFKMLPLQKRKMSEDFGHFGDEKKDVPLRNGDPGLTSLDGVQLDQDFLRFPTLRLRECELVRSDNRLEFGRKPVWIFFGRLKDF